MSGPELLDCGHENTFKVEERAKPGYCGGTGYATDKAGKRICYACCAANDRADMIAAGAATLYLVKRLPTDAREPYAFWHWVTNWPGSLEFRCIDRRTFGMREGARVSRYGGGFGSQRTDAWFNGPDGYVWHAVNRGDNQIARCKRTKEKVRS